MELDCLTHSKLLRDAICLRLQETEEGRDYLRDCWRLQQTEPDFGAIRKFNNLMKK